jgi:hypothetical protein
VLASPLQRIVEETHKILLAAGPKGHILNVGHGVIQVGFLMNRLRVIGQLHLLLLLLLNVPKPPHCHPICMMPVSMVKKSL